MIVCLIAVGVLLYCGIISLAHDASSPLRNGLLVLLLTILASHGGYAFLELRFEEDGTYERWNNVFSWRHQSAAFMMDSFSLSPAFLWATLWWSHVPTFAREQWYYMLVAPVAGCVVAAGFHYGMDRGGYLKEIPTALDSPTKIWHNRITYPVLFSSAVAVLVPFLGRLDMWQTWILIIILLGWVGGVIYDAVRHPKLVLPVLHTGWNARKFQPYERHRA